MSSAGISPKSALTSTAIIAVALMCAALLPASAGAGAGAGKKPAVRIVAPGELALLKGDSVRVAVRTSAGVRSFRAKVGNRDVSRFFHRSGGLNEATLPVGPVLKRGVNYLYVRVHAAAGKEGFAYRRLLVVGHRPELLASAGVAQPQGRGGAPVLVSTRAPRAAVLKGRLNGKPVAHVFTQRGGLRSAELGANDGLHFGRNRLRLLAYDTRGSYDVEAATLVVPRDAPLVGAGPDRATFRGDPLRLDGRSTRAAMPGARLSYRWQVIDAPRGAKPKLRRAHTATPSLRPGGFGTYRVRLTVREGRRASSTDVVTLTVVPDDPPLGVTLHTLVGGKILIGGVPVPGTGEASMSYVILDRTTRAVVAADSFAGTVAGMKQIERAIDARNEPRYMVVVNSREGGLQESARGAFIQLLTRLGGAPLVGRDWEHIYRDEIALSVIGFPGSPPGSAFTNIDREETPGREEGQIVGWLQLRPYAAGGLYGFTFPGSPSFDTRINQSSSTNTMLIGGLVYEAKLPAGGSGFHVVGVDPASLAEEGSQHQFNRLYPTNTGDPITDQKTTRELTQKIEAIMSGDNMLFMQSVGHPKPTTPAWNQLIEAVTAAGGTRALIGGLDGSGGYAMIGAGSENEVQKIGVSEVTHSSFAVLFRGIGTDKIPTGGPAEVIQQTLEGMSSIGKGNVEVSKLNDGWRVEFTGELADRDLPELTLVSPGHSPPGLEVLRQGGLPASYPQAETSEKLSGQPARLTGYLMRSRNSEYRASVSGGGPVDGGGLITLAYSAGEPFPAFKTEGERKANAYIAGELNVGSDVRAGYYKDFRGNWTVRYSQLQGLCFEQGAFSCAGKGFSESEFKEVRKTLLPEILMVTDVQGLITALQEPFDKNKVDAYVNLVAISERIQEEIGKPNEPTNVIAIGILNQMFKVAAGVLKGPAATGSTLIAEGLSKAGDQLRPNGSAVLSEVKSRTTELGIDMLSRYTEAANGLNQLGVILVSDYGKMKTVRERVGVGGIWHEVVKSGESAAGALRTGTKRWFWGALMSTAYRLWQLDPVLGTITGQPPNAREFNCRNGGQVGKEPFRQASELGQVAGVIGFEGSAGAMKPKLQVVAVGRNNPNWDAREPTAEPPSEAMLKPLFEPLSEGGLGLYRPDFYSSHNFRLAPSKFGFLHVGKECGT